MVRWHYKMRLLSSPSALWRRHSRFVVAALPISCALYLAAVVKAQQKEQTAYCAAAENNHNNCMMRTALVVGGTSGIGQGIALALAKKPNVAVTIAGRSKERGEEIVQQLNEISSSSDKHSFQQVNGFDLASVKELATKVPDGVDYLVMTQGMATTQGYTPTTTDGLDQKLQLHYFSRIYLANLLAPKMAERNGRVLTVLSGGVHSRYQDFDKDFELKDNYSIKNAADAAGFYSDAGFDALAQKYPSVVFCHASPGFVNTNWGTEFPWYLKGVVRCLQPLGRSPEKCGELLTNGWLEYSSDKGKNFFLMDQNGKVIADGIKHTPEERDIIWTKTMDLLPKD